MKQKRISTKEAKEAAIKDILESGERCYLYEQRKVLKSVKMDMDRIIHYDLLRPGKK